MSRVHDISGQRFGRLVALARIAKRTQHTSYWLCLCDCGSQKEACLSHLLNGAIKSCGCFRREFARAKSRHGHAREGNITPELRAYYAAKKRCNNPTNAGFIYYGGRGILFKFGSFEEFYKEIGSRPSPEHSLDRIDTNGNYEKGNIQWSTRSSQMRNRRPETYTKMWETRRRGT